MKALIVAAAAAVLSPTPAQITSAVHRVERSPTLWATINVCNTPADPGVIGIRGQMPALGFPAQLQMTVQLEYYVLSTNRFKLVPHVNRRISLGTVTSGTVQGGVEYTFTPPVTLVGAVTFQWKYRGKVLATVVKHTSNDDPGVEHADPRGSSKAICTMG